MTYDISDTVDHQSHSLSNSSASNKLLIASQPILNLVSQIKNTAQLDEIEDLRKYLIEEIHKFENKAKEFGVSNENIIGARYCLCTLLDESAAQTPWGGSGVWSRHSLLVIFYNETWGGEKFFKLLSKLAQNPYRNRDLLQLMFYCISLGFEGRFRIIDNGQSQLETLRQRLWLMLKDINGSGHQLSPHWEGVTGKNKKILNLTPAWVVAFFTIFIAFIIYLLFLFSLSHHSIPISEHIESFQVHKPLIPTPQSIPKKISNFLAAESHQGLIKVHEEEQHSTVTLHGDGLFASGSSKMFVNYLPVIQRIADALISEPGNIIIIGHTDNTPIRSSRYQSNMELSKSRALQVSKILQDRGIPAERIEVQGQGEATPIADNSTEEGRAKNRRVEIILLTNKKSN